jgi:hypothetical protein
MGPLAGDWLVIGLAPFVLYGALLGGLCLTALLRCAVFEAEIGVMSFFRLRLRTQPSRTDASERRRSRGQRGQESS